MPRHSWSYDGAATTGRAAVAGALLAALALLCGGPALAESEPRPGAGAGASPPPAVTVAAVARKPVDRSERFIGNIKAIQSVDLKARVEGFLEQVAFEQGSMVASGDLLYRIEQAPYKADLDSAEGQLAAAKAQSAAAQATLLDKQADFERQSKLLEKGDTSQTAFDQAKAQRDEAQANVEQAAAAEQQAQAAIDNAKINLGYTTIASPIDGRIGATNYTQGNLVDPGSGTLATVVQMDPIRAVFSIPSANYVNIMSRVGAEDRDALREQFALRLILPSGKDYNQKGRIAFVDNRVDTGTGTVAVYADFANPDHILLPGQFVTAVVGMTDQAMLPVVPAAAVQRTRDGAQVYVVGAGNRVEVRKIETGSQVGSDYAVTSGLQEGEMVVVAGIQKIKPGVVVDPTPVDPKPAGTRAAPGAGGASGTGDAAR
ncbi:MAG: efflux RND transporter periplasmic adaptor subunit [Thiohalocapsa sp.]|nr:efflux RND transporter periplasmic adaptor subunit [Thiohalocapsa sp.]